MQSVCRLTQAPAYKSRRTDPAPDFFTCGTLGTTHHEWIGVRQCSLRAKEMYHYYVAVHEIPCVYLSRLPGLL